jgi:hypothetical protein
LAGIVLFGSIWGMLESVLGSTRIEGTFSFLPMGAILGGFFGLGIMAFSRRVYGIMWMQLAMAAVAGFIRFWAPVGTVVICSALAIVAEGLVFELIFNRPVFNITRNSASPLLDVPSLAMLGLVGGYIIYITGYMFTQFFTPVFAAPHAVSISNFVSVLPLILGRGFFAAVLGALSLPLAVAVPQLSFDISSVRKRLYYPLVACVSAFCWVLAFTLA